MKTVKGYTKQVNGGRPQFISEDEYKKLMKEYDEKCDYKRIVDDTEDYFTISYSFFEERNIVRLGWAFYPKFED